VACIDVATSAEAWRVEITGRTLERIETTTTGHKKRFYHITRIKINPDGTRKSYDGANNFPPTERDQVLQLRPTDEADRLDAIRSIFRRFATEAINPTQIATSLNELGATPPAYSEQWTTSQVQQILRNPIYIGRQSFNKNGQSHYVEHVGGQRRLVTNDKGNRRRAKADWIISEPIFPPVIDLDTWAAVQAKLEATPVQKRAPKAAELWLAGLVFCTGCGARMRGYSRKKEGGQAEYICASYASKAPGSKCQRNSITHEQLESYLIDWLDRAGKLLGDVAGQTMQAAPAKRQAAYVAAVEKAINAHHRMHELVGPLSQSKDGKIKLLATPWDRDGNLCDPYEIAPRYRQTYAQQRNKWQAQLDQLETEHTRLTTTWHELPTERAKAKVAARMQELEAQMGELETRLQDSAEDWTAAIAELDRLLRDWTEAVRIVEDESTQRAKAAAVAKVVGRINLGFVPTGHNHPKSRVNTVQIVPVNSDAANCPNELWS
jgi:hypothetical protein